jgi:ubiquinone/menaquinone biosynthesis C-methylase UbiE
MEPDAVAAGYDAVYAAMPNAPTLHSIWREHVCGPDFPPDYYHISFVTLDELARMAGELHLDAGSLLADIGCGAGGPLLWMARHTGASAIGIDVSREGVALARTRAEDLGLARQARFDVGSFDDTGLADASIDAIMSEDALQYAPNKRAAFTEAARVLRRGGRLVFTAFELDRERAAGLPVLGLDVVADYRPVLEDASFSVAVYNEVAGWPEPMTAAYSALLAARDQLVDEMGEHAVNALSGELMLTLERKPYRRRVFVCATRR